MIFAQRICVALVFILAVLWDLWTRVSCRLGRLLRLQELLELVIHVAVQRRPVVLAIKRLLPHDVQDGLEPGLPLLHDVAEGLHALLLVGEQDVLRPLSRGQVLGHRLEQGVLDGLEDGLLALRDGALPLRELEFGVAGEGVVYLAPVGACVYDVVDEQEDDLAHGQPLWGQAGGVPPVVDPHQHLLAEVLFLQGQLEVRDLGFDLLVRFHLCWSGDLGWAETWQFT